MVLCKSTNSLASISKFRPSIPIYAFTPNEETYYQLSLYWGTFAILTPDLLTPYRDVFFKIDEKLKSICGLSKGDRVLIETIENEGSSESAGSGAIFDHVIS